MLFWVSGRQLSGWSIKQKENEPDLAVALMILMTTWQMVIRELPNVTSDYSHFYQHPILSRTKYEYKVQDWIDLKPFFLENKLRKTYKQSLNANAAYNMNAINKKSSVS